MYILFCFENFDTSHLTAAERGAVHFYHFFNRISSTNYKNGLYIKNDFFI